MAPDSKTMNAATPKANSTTIPGTKNSLTWNAAPETPSGAMLSAMTSTTTTITNSKTTTAPRTFADRSTDRTPSNATTSQPASAVSHQGNAIPVKSTIRFEVAKPNSPYRPICIMLYDTSAKMRSEERRVGKECRDERSRDKHKK